MIAKLNVKLASGLLAVILTWFAATCAHAGDSAEIPLARDLALDAQEAQAKGVPMMIVFGSRSCPFCLQLNKEFLEPMRRNPEYDAKVMMRRVDIGSTAPLRLFSGKISTHARFGKENGIKLTPTIKLFDAEGRELTEPLVGLTTPDYYGGFLDQRIDQALAKVRAGK